MKYFKKRLSLFLCLVLAFTTVCFTAPEETKAASTVYFGAIGSYSTTKEIQVAKGDKNLYAGDYVCAYDTSGNSYGYLSMCSNVTYKSSKTSVATINSSTGKITTKKNGTTTISVKFKGQTVKFKLKVVSKSTLKNALSDYIKQYVSTYDDCAKDFLSATGSISKITSSNRYKVLAAYKSYDYKYTCGYTSSYDASSAKSTDYIYSASSAHAYAVCRALDNYSSERNPFSTRSSKCFKIKSISGTSKKVTVTLKDKVSEDQIFGSNYNFSWDTNVKKATTHTFPIYIQDTTNNHRYYAVATIKKGSNKMTIELKNLKLKKNRKYKLVDQYYNSWLDGTVNKTVTFKAKQ